MMTKAAIEKQNSEFKFKYWTHCPRCQNQACLRETSGIATAPLLYELYCGECEWPLKMTQEKPELN